MSVEAHSGRSRLAAAILAGLRAAGDFGCRVTVLDPAMFGNQVRNLAEGRIADVEAVWLR